MRVNGETAGSVREHLYFESLSWIEFPLPPLAEQRQLVARIDALAAKIDEAKRLRQEVEQGNQNLLKAAFRELAENAPRRKLGEVAPLTRRPATINPMAECPQVSVRSFGRGTFQNPPMKGSEITWEKPHRVEAGNILLSNIKAWEGAIAVAKPEDSGRYGSHRYLTDAPVPNVATARFVCFYLLSPEGLFHVGEVSPAPPTAIARQARKAFSKSQYQRRAMTSKFGLRVFSTRSRTFERHRRKSKTLKTPCCRRSWTGPSGGSCDAYSASPSVPSTSMTACVGTAVLMVVSTGV
jgi:hypothetical protein